MPTAATQNSLVDRINVEFQWHPGFALSQKQKNIAALHEAARERRLHPILEVSTKSPDDLGSQFSAFNLRVDHPDAPSITVEAGFQGSKVFEHGGPFIDLYSAPGGQAKRDSRLRDSGRLIGFMFAGSSWDLEPPTAFYDWLYLKALSTHKDAPRLLEYNGFTDIEFNPDRSINCQAKSCALYVALSRRGLLSDATSNQAAFVELLTAGELPPKQSGLLGL